MDTVAYKNLAKRSSLEASKSTQLNSEITNQIRSPQGGMATLRHQSQRLFEEFPDGIAVFSLSGFLLSGNPAFQRLISASNGAYNTEQNLECRTYSLHLRDFLADHTQYNEFIDMLNKNQVVRFFPLVFKAVDGACVDTHLFALADPGADCFVMHVRKTRTAGSTVLGVKLSDILEAILPPSRTHSRSVGLLDRVSAATELLERHYIEQALLSAKGNRAAAARELGLSRQSLYVKLNRYGIGAAQ